MLRICEGVYGSGRMENVEGMLRRMKLSEAERKGIHVKGINRTASHRQGTGRSISPVNAEGLGQASGKIWCPIWGIDCKGLGSNHFLFTFHQVSGKRRALEDGSWVEDLIVVVEFDGKKGLGDIKFDRVPIWLLASRMPLGMINSATGRAVNTRLLRALVV